MIRHIGLLFLLPLAACTAGSDYRPPAITTAPAWRGPPSVPPGAEGPWWKGFRDPDLDRLIEIALAQNLDIEQALARVDQARAALRAAGVARLPGGAIEASAARTRQSTETGLGQLVGLAPGIDRGVSQFDLSAGASWELDLAGGLRRGREAAAYEYEAAEATGAAIRLTVAGEVADAYAQLRAFQAQLAIARVQADSASKLAQLVGQRLALGDASRREAEQATAAAEGARAAIAPLDAGIEAQLNRLAVLLGREPQADRLGLEAPMPVPQAALAGAGAPAQLLRRRPDLVAAERRLAASHARIGVALAEYYPRLSLSALLGFRSNAASNLLSDGANMIQGAAGLRWRLFDFPRIDAEVARARGVEREAIAAYRQAALRAAEEVETSFAAFAQNRARTELLSRQVAAQQRARNLARAAWQAGEISLIDLIQEDDRLLAARTALAGAEAEAARSLIAFHRALGG
ncbi:efflux transporter outer membrane subunit [Sphingomonas sp. BT-65]|uniref:efflux transporter outer membrane subunit n=1 Tax=Sphingomonas sp. BT-65 TaxID=2989821 RepID=UPI0022368046|nr:efflux transporter outer membrane subunit [Sphingomonas sp. BT-65]MCW4461202.1 efflux transporter outer membrane subunit [Sphingomonas sp. BT-65]